MVKKKRVRKVVRKKTVRKPKKKIAKKKAKRAAQKKKSKLPSDTVGVVTHYFPHVQAAVVKILKPLSVGERVEFIGHTSHFSQNIDSMQIDHAPIQKAKKGDEIGLRVNERVREHDRMVLKK